MKRPLAAVAATALSLATTPSFAGPPYATDDPESVEHHHWELYLASQHVHERDGWSGTAPHFEVNYGVVPDLQLHVIAPLAYSAPNDGRAHYGYGDTELGFKLRFLYERKWTPMIGTFPLLKAPSGSQSAGLGNGSAPERRLEALDRARCGDRRRVFGRPGARWCRLLLPRRSPVDCRLNGRRRKPEQHAGRHADGELGSALCGELVDERDESNPRTRSSAESRRERSCRPDPRRERADGSEPADDARRGRLAVDTARRKVLRRGMLRARTVRGRQVRVRLPWCGTGCWSLNSDANNCGACGKHCAGGLLCINGECKKL